MKQTIQKIFANETFTSILLILLTTVITHGISIPSLGYYHDDWFMLWSGQSRGAASIISLFSTDRPFMGYVYSYVYRFLGDSILNWHLYALLWRFIGALAFFWIVHLIWPQQKYITTLMTVLFIVYPGFLSEPNANTKQNHLYGFATALLSIALMLQVLKLHDWKWKISLSLLSLALTLNYLFIYEYMIGFEGVRLLLLGYALFLSGIREFRKLVIETIKRFIPYAIVTAGFLYWRIFLFEGARNATDASQLAQGYLSNLRYMSIRLLLETIKDFLDTTIFAWFVMPYRAVSDAAYADLTWAVLAATLVIALVWVYTRWFGAEYDESQTPHLMREFLWIGGIITAFAVAPVIVSDRQVDLYDAYKSYGLHPILGVALFVMGALLMLQPKFRKLFLMMLIGISVTTQMLNADYWARLWDQQRETWWQLTWRAPDIADQTLIMAYFPEGYRFEQDYEMWGPVNLIYNPEPAKTPAIAAEVLTYETAFGVLRQEVINNRVRDFRVHRDFTKLLLLSKPDEDSCVHVIDGMLPVYAENEPLLTQMIGRYSHPEQIIPTGTAPTPPNQIFGSEPPRDWCYYYQKASLARQQGDWDEIGKLYDEVQSRGLETEDKSEMVPFLEGLANMGRRDDAQNVYDTQIKGRLQLRFPLCNVLAKDPGYPPEFGYDYETIRDILCN